MAYGTHYLGHIQVRPALNEAEFAYLTAFSETPHVVEDAHRYFVSDNPRAPRDVGERGFRVLDRRDDLPDVFCPWVPSCGGECLVVDDLDGQARDAACSSWSITSSSPGQRPHDPDSRTSRRSRSTTSSLRRSPLIAATRAVFG